MLTHTAGSGSLMFNTGPAHGEAIGYYRGDPLYHASLDAAEYEALLARSVLDLSGALMVALLELSAERPIQSAPIRWNSERVRRLRLS